MTVPALTIGLKTFPNQVLERFFIIIPGFGSPTMQDRLLESTGYYL